MNVRKSIKMLCASREINQRELSKITGVSEQTLSKLSVGKVSCSQKTMQLIASGAEIKVSEFIALGEA